MITFDNEVFVYTEPLGERVPRDVVRVWVDPSVTSIPDRAFYERNKLTEVELCEGLVEIGEYSFAYCGHSITKINIPASLRMIYDDAFRYSLQCPILLHDGVESIGEYAFFGCIFTNFRVPSLITVIPDRMLSHCKSTFSVEIPEIVSEIGIQAFYFCYCLRNVAFPPNAVFGDEIFIDEEDDDVEDDDEEEDDDDNDTDLQLLFGSNAEIIRELQHRFDGLPIHKIVYYQSYHQGVLQRLIAAINTRSDQCGILRSKLDPTGNQQDCLGMTPLHILACSSLHNLEVYRLIVENYPANLITEDRWGATPLLYAFWGAAPAEIIQFLLDCYKLLYPNQVFNWTMMVKTIGRCDAPKESIENLLCVKQIHFPDQPIDWGYLLDKFTASPQYCFRVPFRDRMRFLFMCGLSKRVEALAFKIWRDHVTNMIQNATFKWRDDNHPILRRIQEKLAYFEDELPKLKETTTTLELALWKLTMNEIIPQEEVSPCRKKIKTDESSIRQQCRVTCGADIVIWHILPYLITATDEESDANDVDDNESSDSE
jgi:hypothetical protein